ncbi:SDR family NAD(P)-dependent oxidoreductase [Streptomyces sp. NPDC001315]|uniref:SDR family NAD(P)-dependent oxidoreductase n=1 Tax=Streptomyces sp. NPDC001315 TaxID=3364562 RepID=UPI0036B8E7D9
MTDSTKIAIVTGASRGIGRSIALALAREGLDVVITYRSNEQEAAGVVKEVQDLGRTAVALRQDVADFGSLDASVAEIRTTLSDTWGRETFDCLVNNAGIGQLSAFGEIGNPDNIGTTVAAVLSGRMRRVTAQRIEVGGFHI